MMDIEVPTVDFNYDYMIELLISGQYKDHMKDAIISITQVDTGAELNHNMSALTIAAASMEEKEILSAISHLSENEKRKILEVMRRAEALDQQATSRSRQVTTDYVEHHSRSISRQSSLDRTLPAVCPICVDVDIQPDHAIPDGAIPANLRQNVCSECNKTVCKDCGAFKIHPQTKFQVWVCKVCINRKNAHFSAEVRQNRHIGRYSDRNTSGDILCAPAQHSTTQRRSSQPNASAFAPPTPETAPRAQRPNFLQISDREYFGIEASSSSSSLSSGSQKPSVPSVNDNVDSASRCQSMPQSKHNKHKENNNEFSFVDSSDSVVGIFEGEPRHQTLRRLSQQVSGSFESLEGSDSGQHRGSHLAFSNHRHDINNDYYLSEEEELAMIAHHSKHGDTRGDEYNSDEMEPGCDLSGDSVHSIPRSYPTHEWSPPLGDLSPIEDVSSTVELEAEAEWLAYQRNGLSRRRSESVDSETDCVMPRSRSRGIVDPVKDTRLRTLSVEIDSMLRHPSLEIVKEQSSIEDSMSMSHRSEGLAEQTSEEYYDKDKDSQTSTVESGYESQSKDQQHTSTSGPPNPLPRSTSHRKHAMSEYAPSEEAVTEHTDHRYSRVLPTTNASEEAVTEHTDHRCSRVLPTTNAFENCSFEADVYQSISSSHDRKDYEDRLLSGAVAKDRSIDYIPDIDDGVPFIAEGTTFNIHGGRDMFAKRSPAKSADKVAKPVIARKPSLEKIARSRSMQRQNTLDSAAVKPHVTQQENSMETDPCANNAINSSDKPMSKQLHNVSTQERRQLLKSKYSSDDSLLISCETTSVDCSGTPTHISLQTGVLVKHREIQVSSPLGNSPQRPPCSSAAMLSTTNTKPIPAPRRKPDNSLRAKSSANNNHELDDEIVEIRFDDDSSLPARNHHKQSANESKGSVSESKSGSRRSTRLKSNGRSVSVDLDVKTANIKRSMDELRKREQDENEITKDLERQLAEIRRLEERQRNILQNTLRQVVHSVNDNQNMLSQTSTSHKDEIPMDARIDYSSLLSPSFNRKTPLNSPLLPHKSSASPQSPRKLSSAGRRQDMHTICENGGYTMTELAAMSPASSHRTLSGMASPILPQRPDYGYLGSHSLPPRADRQAPGLSAGLSFGEKNFRLSASYTELPPHLGGDVSDKSGYFSDRETDRRRGGDDLKNYTDEARRAFLQFEIEKRRTQVEENNHLRTELQRLIQSGSIPAAKYERLRDMYRDHINRSREYLGLSNSSLSSISTSKNIRLGYEGYTTDSDFMSSTEQLAGNLSQSSTVERFMQSNDNLYKHSIASKHTYSSTPSNPASRINLMDSNSITNTESTSQPRPSETNNCNDDNSKLPAMPLLDIRAPKSSVSSPNSACELVKIGDISRAASDASFGDPEERIIDAKLEGGKTIIKSKEKEATLKNATAESMPVSRFNFPTKQILVTPDSISRERGLGLEIRGGVLVPQQHGVMGAFVQEISPGSVAAQLLGELKPGDEIVEWNGVCLRNKTDLVVQDVISHWNGVIEITVRLDKQPYRLPRHRTSRADYENHYQSTENVSGGFESPLSDKSWSKEFDLTSQSTIRRASSIKSSSNQQVEVEVNDDFTRISGHNKEHPRPVLREEQIQQSLHDMSERLDHLDREPQSPPEEYSKDRRELSHLGSLASTTDFDFRDSDIDQSANLFQIAVHPSSQDNTHQQNNSNSNPSTQQRNTLTAPGSVTRSSSDMTAAAQSNRNREVILAEQGTRRMSHQERLRHPPPLSPRTGRHPNIPRLKVCGEIEAMLMYDYSQRMLVITIERGVGLALAGEQKINPFIKVHFLKNNQVTEKRCTRYIEDCDSPKWEQFFTFRVEEDELNLHKIKMAAWHYFQPRQNVYIGAATIDLSRQQHVDGNLRMYKLDSDPGDRRDSAQGSTPFLQRVNRPGQQRFNKQPNSNGGFTMVSPARTQRGATPPVRATAPRVHTSPHHSNTPSQHSSPQHSQRQHIQSPQHGHGSSGPRSVPPSSEHISISRGDSPSHQSISSHSLQPSSRHSRDSSDRNSSLNQPSLSHHSEQFNSHSGTNGISRNSQEINNNGIKPGNDMRRTFGPSEQQHRQPRY